MRTLYFALWLLSSSFYLFPHLISAVADWMSTILLHMGGPSANLICRSETCCTRLAEKNRTQKVAKNRHLGTIAQLCWARSSQLRHVSTIRKKNLLNSNISSICPHNMANVAPLAPEIVSLVCGTPGNFNGFRVLASLLQRHRSTEAIQTLHDVWPSPGLVDYIYIIGGSCPGPPCQPAVIHP